MYMLTYYERSQFCMSSIYTPSSSRWVLAPTLISLITLIPYFLNIFFCIGWYTKPNTKWKLKSIQLILTYIEKSLQLKMKHCIRQAICFSHLTFCITLNFIFGYCFRACLDLKLTVYMFCWYLLVTWPWRHGWKRYAHKTYYIWCHWKENFMLINICYRTYIWFLFVFGLLTFK